MSEARSTFDRAWGRRSVVVAGGAAAGLVALQATPGGRALLAALVDHEAVRRADGTVRVERIRREADQLALDLVLVDMVVESRGDTSWVRPSGSSPGYLGFVLPAQSMGEEYSRANTALTSTTAYVKSELALPSVLAFSVPVGTTMAFDLPALLDWEGLGPLWTGDPTRPSSVIEAPYRVRLKPHSSLVWEHDAEPQVDDGTGTTQLWHTRLETVDFEGAATKRILTVPATLASSLKLPLDTTDRKAIAKQANTYHTSSTHAPVVAERLILSPLGATMELHGAWPGADKLVSWDHRTTLGRDQYVKTVNRGFLAPWGHPAVLIEETWRRMRTATNGRPIAVLQKIITILVTDPVVDTDVEFARSKDANGKNTSTRGSRLPFTSVRCMTRLSPPLRDREVSQIKNLGGVPRLEEDGSFLRFPFEGTDWEGNRSVFTSVVSFVPGAEPPQGIALGWNGEDLDLRTVDFAGQPMAVAPVRSGVPGSTRLPVGLAPVRVEWISPAVLGGRRRAPFRPYLSSLMATVPALTALTGKGELKHTWPIAYILDEDNPGGVVLRADKPASAPIDHQRTGGMAPPPATYQGFSSTTGAVLASSASALDHAAQGVGKAAAVFDGLTLLGQIPLTGIVDNAFGLLPQAVTEVVDGRQTVTLTMSPSLHKYALGPIVFAPGNLVLTSVTAAGGDRPAEQSLDALLTDATLQLAGVVKMPIERLRVTSATGAPLDIELELGDLSFLGPLGFVQTLAEVLAPLLSQGRVAGGHARPAARGAAGGALSSRRVDVDVDTEGVHLSQAIAFPDVSVGVFTLTGLGFDFGLDLLFAGGLVADFAFASHENPFQVSYGPFGGGGYCALRLTGGEITNLEVSLMVAGGFGLNLGVAAGAVSVQAGLVLCLPAGQPVSLTAFFRASGCLEVLGLVSVSVVFEISLTWGDTDPVTLYGAATLSMKVEVMWVSKTVKASVTKTLTGGAKKSGVPTSGLAAGSASRRATEEDRPFRFRDTYPDRDPWLAYAAAYAPGQG